MRILIGILFLLFSQYTNAQKNNENELIFEAGYGFQSFDMQQLNQNYIRDFAQEFDILDDEINNGQKFDFRIAYRPNQLWDIGIYSMFQEGKSESEMQVL